MVRHKLKVRILALYGVTSLATMFMPCLANAEQPTLSASKKTQLSGTQTEKVVTLDAKDGLCQVVGDYVVPIGSELIIEKGVKVLFNLKCGLTVLGKLTIKGSAESPVVLRGSSTGLKAWNGIKIMKCKDCTMAFAHVSGAVNALDIQSSEVKVCNSTFYRNSKVANIQERDGKTVFENCLMSENKVGVHFHYSKVEFSHCTISENKEYAIEGSYYGDIALEKCIVAKNGSGIKDGGYEGTMIAHNCSIFDNRQFDVKNESSVPGDFTSNWWGKKNTALLKMKKGNGVKLPKVLGKFVNIAEFLEEPSEGCGAQSCPAKTLK